MVDPGAAAAENGRPLLAVSGLHKAFGSVAVLNGIDLTVETGQVAALVGTSGSGKTTLLRCLNLLEQPTAGRIEIDGRAIFHVEDGVDRARLSRRDVARMRAEIGMVFQHFNLFPHMTVLQNVMEGPRTVKREAASENRDRARALLDKVGLAGFEDRYPAQLSGGQQQRVSIARALNMRPRLMLFDEPTSALDPELVGEVLTAMMELAREGMTMVVVTHELGFALDVADKVVFLDAGQVAEEGPPRQVLLRPTHPRLVGFVNRFHQTADLLRPLLEQRDNPEGGGPSP